jgi:hypothetical protein
MLAALRNSAMTVRWQRNGTELTPSRQQSFIGGLHDAVTRRIGSARPRPRSFA